MMPAREKAIEMKKLAAALQQQVDQARAKAETAELARDKAEAAVRKLDRELAATRDRLERAENRLRSLGMEA